jgi:hypothetical protein
MISHVARLRRRDGRFLELLRLLSAAAIADVTSEAILAALAFVTSLGEDTRSRRTTT